MSSGATSRMAPRAPGRQGYGASIRLFKHAQIENGLSEKDTWA